MRIFTIFIVKSYQKILSPQTGVLKLLYFSPIFSLTPGQVGCRHSVTCSQYAINELKEQRYAVVALIKTSRRILNCHF